MRVSYIDFELLQDREPDAKERGAAGHIQVRVRPEFARRQKATRRQQDEEWVEGEAGDSNRAFKKTSGLFVMIRFMRIRAMI